MNTLAIDTSNQVLGVAIMQKNNLIAEMMTNINKDHSSRLMPAIVDIMEKVEMTPEQLDKIIVANGPGSYTGTRIGVTTAKTLAWSLDIPIYTVSSLEALAYNGSFFNGYICPFFDARRKTVFTGLYKFDNGQLITVKEESNMSMENWLNNLASLNEEILFLSPHIVTFSEMIRAIMNQYTTIPESPFHLPKPSNLILLSENKTSTQAHFVNPNYLRITEAEAKWLKSQKDEKNNG